MNDSYKSSNGVSLSVLPLILTNNPGQITITQIKETSSSQRSKAQGLLTGRMKCAKIPRSFSKD